MKASRGFLGLVVLGSALTVNAQWSVVYLHPPTTSMSNARAVNGGRQVGTVQIGANNRAALWSGTSASYVNLHPTNASDSEAVAVSGNVQGGSARIAGVTRASIWTGTAGSRVDLHPDESYRHSWVFAVDGNRQVGTAIPEYGSNKSRASLWSGTRQSWVDLSPAGSTQSVARAINGARQGGFVMFGSAGIGHAALWASTAESWVNVNPTISRISGITGMSDDQQVGSYIRYGDTQYRAGLWSGTAESFIDLHPEGYTSSELYAVFGGKQVGQVYVGDYNRAAVWSGSSDSMIDLHSLLPSGFTSSTATGITSDGINFYITGSGYFAATGRSEAIMWSTPVPEPSVFVGFAMACVALRARRKASIA